MRITVLAAIWGERLPVELCFVRHHLALHPELTLSLAVSPGVDLPPQLAYHERVAVTVAPNQPLGAKHNAAIWSALTRWRVRPPRHAVVMGSDDFLSGRLLETLAELAGAGASHVALRDGFFADRVAREAVYWPGYGPSRKTGLGAGRLVDLQILTRAGGWPAERTRALDAGLVENLGKLTREPPMLHSVKDSGPIACTKGAVNIWRMGAIQRTVPIDFNELVAEVGVELPRE